MTPEQSQKQIVPAPFLGPVFEPDVEPVIATGFNYHPTEIAMHGVERHQAIDFDVPAGTPILSPADGYYLASYGEFLVTNEDDTPRTMSMQQAVEQSGRDRKRIRPPDDGDGPWNMYFGSYVIQSWHTRGRYTQYAHVETVNPMIPYHVPTEQTDEDGNKTGNLMHSALLRAPVSEYRKKSVAAFVTAGTVIGTVGSTGCGWGRRAYDDARFEKDGRPTFAGTLYTYYAEPHLHFMTFARRAPHTRKPVAIWDPFGVYGMAEAGYPKRRSEWSKLPNSLWLPQSY